MRNNTRDDRGDRRRGRTSAGTRAEPAIRDYDAHRHRGIQALARHREEAEQLYEALLATDMRLPRVDSVIGWAYEVGLLPA